MMSKLFPYSTLPMPELTWPKLASQDIHAVVILAVFAVLFYIEARWTYMKASAGVSRQSYMSNLGTFILNDTLLSLLSISSLWALAERYSGLGILNWIENPIIKGIAAFVLLDLVLYVWHWACHQADWLWRFHRIHHSDPSMNVSTAFRTHIVETFLTSMIKAVFIVLTGVHTATLLMTEALITVATLFHHANIRFPGERKVGQVAIVPYLHRVHHSTQRQEHDANYGAFLSLWDRLFGTIKEVEPERLGLQQVDGQGVLELFLFGFKPFEAPPSVSATSPDLRRMIQEAAYYRAEQRGFVPGFEFKDWFEAEREILGEKKRMSQ